MLMTAKLVLAGHDRLGAKYSRRVLARFRIFTAVNSKPRVFLLSLFVPFEMHLTFGIESDGLVL